MNEHLGKRNVGMYVVTVLFFAITMEGCGAKSDMWDPESLFPEEDGSVDMDIVEEAEEEEEAPILPSTWIVRLGGDEADMAETVVEAGGGIVVAGQTRSFTTSTDPGSFDIDMWIIKLGLDGDLVWQKALGDTGTDAAYAMIEARNGNVIVAGSTGSYGAGWTDMWVLEMNASGSVLEQKAIGTSFWDHAYSLAETSDGGLVFAGPLTDGFDSVVKLAENGSVQWHVSVSFANLYSIVETSDGGYAVAGNWSINMWIGKLDRDGGILWQKEIRGVRSDAAWSIIKTRDGNLVVSGNTEHFTTMHETRPLDLWIGKLDPDGNLLWQKTVGGEWSDIANAVTEDPDGNLIIAGTGAIHEDGDYDMVAMKMAADGAVLWQKMIGGSGDEVARSVAVTSDGGLVIAGSVWDDDSSSPDVLIVKLGSDGQFNGYCTLVRDAAFSSEESRLTINDITLNVWTEGDVVLQAGNDTPRDSGAEPAVLCPE